MTDETSNVVQSLSVAEVADVELYHPKSWITKWVFSQERRSSPFSTP